MCATGERAPPLPARRSALPPKGVPRYPGKMVVEFQPIIEPGLNRKAFMKELENRVETASMRLFEDGKAAQGAKIGQNT